MTRTDLILTLMATGEWGVREAIAETKEDSDVKRLDYRYMPRIEGEYAVRNFDAGE